MRKTMLKIDINSHKLEEVEMILTKTTTEELHQIYELLECNLIDITVTKIGKTMYAVICDDEGLLKANHTITLFEDNQPRLVGRLLITMYNGEGENIGLTKEQIQEIKENHLMLGYYDSYTNELIKTNQFKHN